jgi:hypothetical protein
VVLEQLAIGNYCHGEYEIVRGGGCGVCIKKEGGLLLVGGDSDGSLIAFDLL